MKNSIPRNGFDYPWGRSSHFGHTDLVRGYTSAFHSDKWHPGRARLLLTVERLWVFPCLLAPSLTCLFSIAEYTVINEACPGAEWNIMCRECCEYDQIECVCPGKKEVVGYTIPCCRNEDNECDSCLIHPGECAMGHHKLSSHYLGHGPAESGRLDSSRQPAIQGCDAMVTKGDTAQLSLTAGKRICLSVIYTIGILFRHLVVHLRVCPLIRSLSKQT